MRKTGNQYMYTPLPLQLRKNGYDYKQVKRNEHAAIYEQSDDGIFIAYEVFAIETQEASERNGIKYEAKELFPHNERFGKKAWSVKTIERAEQLFDSLSIIATT